MTITTAQLISYIKGLDTRFNAMTDAAVLEQVKLGVNILSAKSTHFVKKEEIPLQDYADNGIYTFMIVPQEEVMDYIDIYSLSNIDGKKADLGITYEKNMDKTITVTMPDNRIDIRDYSVSVSYFYYLNVLSGGSYEIEPDIYTMMKHAIQIVFWGLFKDHEKEAYHQNQLTSLLSTKIVQMPEEVRDFEMGGIWV